MESFEYSNSKLYINRAIQAGTWVTPLTSIETPRNSSHKGVTNIKKKKKRKMTIVSKREEIAAVP